VVIHEKSIIPSSHRRYFWHWGRKKGGGEGLAPPLGRKPQELPFLGYTHSLHIKKGRKEGREGKKSSSFRVVFPFMGKRKRGSDFKLLFGACPTGIQEEGERKGEGGESCQLLCSDIDKRGEKKRGIAPTPPFFAGALRGKGEGGKRGERLTSIFR